MPARSPAMARQVHNDQAGPSSSWDVKAGINKAGDLADVQFRQSLGRSV